MLQVHGRFFRSTDAVAVENARRGNWATLPRPIESIDAVSPDSLANAGCRSLKHEL
jgi:hypothetical protein